MNEALHDDDDDDYLLSSPKIKSFEDHKTITFILTLLLDELVPTENRPCLFHAEFMLYTTNCTLSLEYEVCCYLDVYHVDKQTMTRSSRFDERV